MGPMPGLYAAALKQAFSKRTSVPHGIRPSYPKEAILAALKRSTRGMQRTDVANAAADEKSRESCGQCALDTRRRLRGLLREICIWGTEVQFEATAEDGSLTLMAPYPAFKWRWETRLSFPWKRPQHINVLEVSAFLVEFRRP